MRRMALACAVLSNLASVAPTHAQSSALEPVVITASRTEQRLQDALPATTLITRAQIDATMASDLASLLRQAAGVEISQNGGQGTLASAFIRGAESRHTLLLIDGVAANNLSFGTAALEHLPLDNVERNEIVRGNVSSLYGSAAIGGVIQVFTRQAGASPQAHVGMQWGGNGLHKYNADVSTRLSTGTTLSATLESLDAVGFNAINQNERPGTNPDRDGYSRRAATFSMTQPLGLLAGGSEASTLGLRWREARGTTQYDSQYGPADQADESRFVERGAVLDGHFSLASGLKVNAAITNSADLLNAQVTAYPYLINSFSTGSQLGVEWLAVAGQRLSGGYEHTRQHVSSDTVYTKDARQQDSVRLGYQGDFAQQQLQLNLRQDRYSDFGVANTYFAGYAWRITPQWRLNASASTGFNAPTFNDLYYPWGGNAALRPERVQSAELGLQYARQAQEFRAVLFNNRFHDLIGNDANFNRVNVDIARNQGLELSYRGKWGPADLRASLTAQDPIDLSSGKRLPLRAATLAKLGAGRDYGAWGLDADLRYSGARPDGSETLGAYAVLDLAARCTLGPDWKASARVENLLQRQYETVYGYRQTPRTLTLGVTWQPRL